jgi:uncharacterized protein YukE
MTRNQSLFFRLVLFLAGAGVILLAFFLTTGGKELEGIDAYVWVSIGLMYLAFFMPFFFSSITIGNFSGKIPKLTILWPGIILYIIASLVIILLLAAARVMSLNAAIISHAVVIFLFAINVYFACFASSHAGRVAAEEADIRRNLTEIKARAQALSLLVNRLPAEYENAQKTLRQAVEEIKYIYPVSSGAEDVEQRLFASVNKLSELCGGVSSNAHPANLENEAQALLALVKERKLLRN